MKIIADLHIHSTFSDGYSSPEELISILKKEKIEYCCLTDHDTVNGVERFINAANSAGIKAFSGIELSCFENNFQIHILGYNMEYQNPILVKELEAMLAKRKIRISAFISALREQGIAIDAKEFFKRFKGPYWGRPHIAQFLIETGVVDNFQTAFDLYLSPDRPAYQLNTGLTVAGGIDLIHKFGGLAVLAHPVLYQKDFPLRYWQNFDFDGVELIHPAQKSEQKIRAIRKYSKRNNLFVTGGSDYHGNPKGKYIKNGITFLDMDQFPENNILLNNRISHA